MVVETTEAGRTWALPGDRSGFEQTFVWEADSVPNVIVYPGGAVYVLIGKYAAPGERYWYRRADLARVDAVNRLERIELVAPID